MIRIITIFFFLAFPTILIMAQEIAKVELKEFDSQFFTFKRPVFIYTPEGYEECTQSVYDVIYVFDAQSRANFDEVHSLLHFGVQQPNNDRQYIVVGVASPTLPDIEYCRNNDFLPKPKFWNIESPYYGSLDKFKGFLKEELIPFINNNYRTSGHTLGIGHSLGASFVIDAMTTDDMFDDIIAISPNMAWDNDYYANKLRNFNFNGSRPRFIYLAMGNEGLETDELQFPKIWRESWENIKNYLDSIAIPGNIVLRIADLPECSHNQVVLSVHLRSLKEYASYRYCPTFNDDKYHPVHIELSGASVTGDVYITGNQPELADWNPKGVKMKVLNDTTRVIELNLRLPAEFKFTKGSWDYQYYIINGDAGNQRISSSAGAVRHYKTH